MVFGVSLWVTPVTLKPRGFLFLRLWAETTNTVFLICDPGYRQLSLQKKVTMALRERALMALDVAMEKAMITANKWKSATEALEDKKHLGGMMSCFLLILDTSDYDGFWRGWAFWWVSVCVTLQYCLLGLYWGVHPVHFVSSIGNCLFVCLFVCLSVCLFVCLFVCLWWL